VALVAPAPTTELVARIVWTAAALVEPTPVVVASP
jgi:hypothetical protein